MFCSYCGTEYGSDSHFCENCGMNLAVVGEDEATEINRLHSRLISDNSSSTSREATAANSRQAGQEFCEKCGKGNEPDSAFCEQCGNPLSSSLQPRNGLFANFSGEKATTLPHTNPKQNYREPEVSNARGRKGLVIGCSFAAIILITTIAITLFISSTSDTADELDTANKSEESSPVPAPSFTQRSIEGSQEETTDEHTIVFETGGGTTYEQEVAKNGSVIVTPTEPIRPGYVFEGWFSDRETTVPFGFPHSVEESDPEIICIYAKWVDEATYYDSYGSMNDTAEYEYNGESLDYYDLYMGCIFPQSSDEYLSDSDLVALTKEEAQRAINEIFARNGYIFQSALEERAYFESQPWYEGTEIDMNNVFSNFNEYERENIRLLQDYRDRL